jgi:hypothetical protein
MNIFTEIGRIAPFALAPARLRQRSRIFASSPSGKVERQIGGIPRSPMTSALAGLPIAP